MWRLPGFSTSPSLSTTRQNHFDKGDRMIEMGFEDDLKVLVSELPASEPQKQVQFTVHMLQLVFCPFHPSLALNCGLPLPLPG